MPNKRVNNLKDEGDRGPAQQWQKAMGLSDMTTREWNEVANRASSGEIEASIRRDLKSRRKG